jgi:uncharacterized protein with von Willebrand factor type A (vWA) domain
VALDRDIAIRWSSARQAPGCTLRTSRPGSSADTYGLLTVVPPATSEVTFDRDLVLLLDVSGSMAGRPLDCLKTIVAALIDSLSDPDRLEMIAFSSRVVAYRTEPALATAAERRKARTWVERLEAGGGTELIPAIHAALQPLRADVPRQVIIVTDGLIGFESDAVRAIRDDLPRGSRLHAVGVGSASNRAFLRPAAKAGRGVEILVDLGDAASAAERIVAATRQPVVVDVKLEGTALQEPAAAVPDVLSGAPVLASLRLRPEGGTLKVLGRTAHGSWQEQLEVPETAPGFGLPAIRTLWARETIERLELDLACGGPRDAIECRIEQIALEHSVASRLTSWVAIAEEPSVDPREPIRVERIPQALPYGMSASGLGLLPLTALAAPQARAADSCSDFELALSYRLGGPFTSVRYGALLPPWLLGNASSASRQAIAELASLLGDIERLVTSSRLPLARSRTVRTQAGEHERLLHRLDQLVHEAERTGVLDVERLMPRIEELREALIDHQRRSAPEPVALRGRILRTPSTATTMLEILVTISLDWQPASSARVGGRTVGVIGQGTTRPGALVAGSLARVELADAPDRVRTAGHIELGCVDRVLVVTLERAK